jgi:hypothetical protein
MATRKGKPRAAAAKAKPKKPAAKPVKKASPRPAAAAARPARAKTAKSPKAGKSPRPLARIPEPAAQILLEPPDPSDAARTIVANMPLDSDEAAPRSDQPAKEDEEEPHAEEPSEPEPEEEDSGEVISFEGVLTPNQPAGTYVPLTREMSERFPGQGIVHVKGRVGGVAIQSSLMPMGDGTRSLGVQKATMEQGGFHHGDPVKVAIRLDTAPREVVVPRDFSDALEKSPKARRTFANYAFSHRKEYVNWIEEAKQPETRQRRIDQSVRMIEANEKLS